MTLTLIALGILANLMPMHQEATTIIHAGKKPITIKAKYRKMDADLACLTKNIYYEARGESTVGQIAVGLVTLQRVDKPGYPATVCGVVYAPGAFSWVGDPARPKIDPNIYHGQSKHSARLAKIAYGLGFRIGDHYHSNKVRPRWLYAKDVTVKIGNHTFYQ